MFRSRLGSSPTILAEVDTGAAITVAPRGLASDLRLKLGSGAQVRLLGVGGTSVAWIHLLDVWIGGNVYPSVPVAITEDDASPFLLGRLGFFDKATVTFDGATKSVRVGPSA